MTRPGKLSRRRLEISGFGSITAVPITRPSSLFRMYFLKRGIASHKEVQVHNEVFMIWMSTIYAVQAVDRFGPADRIKLTIGPSETR
jgi:hypothetical protein